ncbi:MAG TPA: M50 family metallopeptidase, partial [Herpetosiphonaceae bacterium]|nr:M50 family metallopeptidase [Herpetosiphonaceae bacterium]
APRSVLLALGVVLAIMGLLFVRNLFGMLAGLALVAALIGAATKLEPRWSGALLLFLTVQMCLKSLDSLWDLLRISTSLRGRATTDAQIMQQITGVPGLVWALLWSAAALLILWQSVRIAYFKG